MTCPGCQSHSSDILNDFTDGVPCRYCGLSAAAAFEIQGVRQSRADDALKGRVEELVKEADQWRRRAERAENFVVGISDAVGDFEIGQRGEG